jgi:hypothetical protein
MLDKTLNAAGNGVNCRIALGIAMIEEHTMAISSWTPAQPQTWIEKYRAALIETSPTVRLERIDEACHAIEDSMEVSDAYERHAIEDARLILRLLREESLGRADSAPWL